LVDLKTLGVEDWKEAVQDRDRLRGSSNGSKNSKRVKMPEELFLK